MAFPGAVPQRTLYNTAKRVRDELGKGQEVLRQFRSDMVVFPATATRVEELVGLPDVDIKVVGISIVTTDVAVAGASNTVDVKAGATAFNTAPAAGNRLMNALATADLPVNVVVQGVLTGNATLVRAGSPIILDVLSTVTSSAGEIYAVVFYILADDARSY